MADAVLQDGGVAFALINSEGLLGNGSAIASRFYRLYPSHWVTILGNISIAPLRSGRVEFDLYSWGRKIHVKTQSSELKNIFGRFRSVSINGNRFYLTEIIGLKLSAGQLLIRAKLT